MDKFAEHLRSRLEEPLPGFEAQRKMAPRPADNGRAAPREAPPDAISSGVMLLFFPQSAGSYEIILTQRSEDIEQGGQICLPGGRSHPGETPTETALRETREEIGLEPASIQTLGSLSTIYVTTSNSLIQPTVGYLDERPQFRLDPKEVQEVFAVGLNELTSSKNLITERWTLHNRPIDVPFWDIHNVPLWGATAMILAEFILLYSSYSNLETGIFEELD